MVREDLVNPNLLFVGTEFGLFHLHRWRSALGAVHRQSCPTWRCAISSFIRASRTCCWPLTAAAFIILDDLTPLRALTPEILAKDAALLPSRPATLALPAASSASTATAEFVGRTLPEAAPIVYYQKKRHIFGDLKVEIYDPQGKLVTTVAGRQAPRPESRAVAESVPSRPKVPPAAGLVENQFAFFGPQVQEGTYTVKLIKGKETYTTKIKLVPDPRSRAPRPIATCNTRPSSSSTTCWRN